MTVRKNLYELVEIPIDLSDVVLKGSVNSVSQQEEIISRFRIKFNLEDEKKHNSLRVHSKNEGKQKR